jgi:hypothetical protein
VDRAAIVKRGVQAAQHEFAARLVKEERTGHPRFTAERSAVNERTELEDGNSVAASSRAG